MVRGLPDAALAWQGDLTLKTAIAPHSHCAVAWSIHTCQPCRRHWHSSSLQSHKTEGAFRLICRHKSVSPAHHSSSPVRPACQPKKSIHAQVQQTLDMSGHLSALQYFWCSPLPNKSRRQQRQIQMVIACMSSYAWHIANQRCMLRGCICKSKRMQAGYMC